MQFLDWRRRNLARKKKGGRKPKQNKGEVKTEKQSKKGKQPKRRRK
jgi:hypothetical protein